MPASASPPPSPPVRTPGQQPSHPASATNRSRTPQDDRFALYSPRNPDRRWIRDKAELVERKGPWRGLDDLEYATLEWVDWFDHRRLFSAIGYVPPAEYEANLYRGTVPAEAGTQ